VQILHREIKPSNIFDWKRRENGENVNPISKHLLVARSLGGPWTGWIGSAPVQMSGCCLGASLSWLHVGCCGVWLFLNDLSFLCEQSLWSFSGLEFCVLIYWGLCCTAAFPLIFLQLRKGPLWSCAEHLQGYSHIGSVWNSKTALARGPRTALGNVGKRGWGVEGYWCLRKWLQWSPNCESSNSKPGLSPRCLYTINKRTLLHAELSQELNKRFQMKSQDYLKVVFSSWKNLCSNMIITTSNPSYLELLGLCTVHTNVSTNASLSLQLW